MENITNNGIKLKDLKQGDYFTLKPILYPTEKQVYIREEYDRTEKKYWCSKWCDICAGRYLKGDRIVYTDLIF